MIGEVGKGGRLGGWGFLGGFLGGSLCGGGCWIGTGGEWWDGGWGMGDGG